MGCAAPQSGQFPGPQAGGVRAPPGPPSTPGPAVGRPPTSSPMLAPPAPPVPPPASLSLVPPKPPSVSAPPAPPGPDSPSRRFFIQDPRTYGTLSSGGNPRMLEVDYATYVASQNVQKASPAALRPDDIPPPTQHMELSPGLLYTQGAGAATAAAPLTPTRAEKGKKGAESKGAALNVPNALKVPEKTADALKWYQKQLAQRRYMGLQTAEDVGAFVAKKLKVSAPTAKAAPGIFKGNKIQPKEFVTLDDGDLNNLGVANAADREKIILGAHEVVTKGRADAEGFLMTVLAYQFQQMLAVFFNLVRDDCTPERLIANRFQPFVESLEWYKAGYAGGKKELTAFQREILYVDFLLFASADVENGILVNVPAVARDLVAKSMARKDDVAFNQQLGLNEAKLTETLELAGSNVVTMMKPYNLQLFAAYRDALTRDIDKQKQAKSPGTSSSPATLQALLKSIGASQPVQAIVRDCTVAAQKLVDDQAKVLGKSLLQSVWPTLPDIYA